MNKKIGTCIVISICFLLGTLTCSAENFSKEEIGRIYQGIFENLGGGPMMELVEQAGIPSATVTDPAGLAKFFRMDQIVSFLTGGLPEIITEALLDFRMLLVIILVYALASALQGVSNLQMAKAPLQFTFVLAVALSVYQLTGDTLRQAQEALMDASKFLSISVPVLIGAEVAGGRAVTAMILPGGIAMVISMLSSFNSTYLAPLVHVFFSIALASAVHTNASLKGICKSMKELIIFALKFITTILVGILSLQRVITKAADTFSGEIAKFALGSFVPIVGGIITDAFGVVITCAKTLRATVGTAGVAVIVAIMLPILVRVVLYTVLFKIAAGCAGIFESGVVSDFFKSVGDMWSILLAITICQGVYFVATLALLAT